MNQLSKSQVKERVPFSIMSKPAGSKCNIDCKYCYYLEKEKLFPSEKKFKMNDKILEQYIKQQIEASCIAGMKEVPFAWQGGEPTLLGIDYFKRIIALQKKYAPKGVDVTNAIQTNGILLNRDWGLFLKEYNFLVGISIDGPKELHDRYRVYRAGTPTFDSVIKGLDILQNEEVDFNVLTTVHHANTTKGAEVYKFLKSLGVKFIQFIPIVERVGHNGLAKAPQIENGDQLKEWSVRPLAYGKFLCDVFDVWFKKDIGEIFVQFFDVQVGLWLGKGSSLCVFSETCGNALAIEHDGSLFSCDHYVYPEYKLGNILDQPLKNLVWNSRQTEFGQEKKSKLTSQCQKCKFRFACNGGCPKHRFAKSKAGEEGHNYFCESYLRFFMHAGDRLKKMAEAVASGQPASIVAQRRVKSQLGGRHG